MVLGVTGGEALYADMGHFGAARSGSPGSPSCCPGLLLNYFGQGALLLVEPPGTVENPFYAPRRRARCSSRWWCSRPLAAIVASQALISGVFSLTRQAVQLGYLPRVTIVHTSRKTEGQIYIPEVNSC